MNWLQWHPRINSLGRVRCEPGWDLRWTEPDRLTDYDLWFVWAGMGRMRLMDREVDLHAGRCFWMRPGRTYVADQDPAGRLGVTYIHFDLIGADGLVAAHDFPGLPDRVQQFVCTSKRTNPKRLRQMPLMPWLVFAQMVAEQSLIPAAASLLPGKKIRPQIGAALHARR